MINTYHSSMASLPPPLPPRRSQVLVEPQASSAGRSKTLLRSLLGVVVLHFLLTAGGFIFLYYTGKTETTPQLSGDAPQQSSSRTLARMIVAKPKDLSALDSRSGNLQWDMKHSVRNNINYYHNSWLTALQPGDYVVFSRVTFSKADPVKPLASAVKLRRGESAKETVAMLAYCSLDTSGSGSNPQLCTASMGEVMSLERGNQLSLWVEDRSLVDYSRAATSFGMYKL
ncbi:CD40 ligand isoform X1 [Syngnathus acus]|uniref:CD40 ligand isoform X1 n=1 Tax=Syngnathus acus TaxID=161584 RepID=UPI0018862841|nr:CD40 ligand isoform X1 [Syngnathus acus]